MIRTPLLGPRQRRHRVGAVRSLTAAALAVTAAARPGPGRAATPEQIDDAVGRAKAFLYAQQGADGSWEPKPKRDTKGSDNSDGGGQWGGRTALIVSALLAAGDDEAHQPKLAAAVAWLKKADVIGVYALGMRSQVWLALPDTAEVRKLMQADADALGRGFNTSGRGQYLYNSVVTKRNANRIDHRMSQFGVLGMWAAEQMRPESVPDSYWIQVESRWIKDQQPDGGWFPMAGAPTPKPRTKSDVKSSGGKTPPPPPKDTPKGHPKDETSITAAAVSTLFITQDYAHPETARCNGNVTTPAIDKGIAYLGAHRDDWVLDEAEDEDHPAGAPWYTLYAVQRIGAASGLKYIGDVDWYAHGAEWCVRHQLPSGAWRSDTDTGNTGLVLLFLARGRDPILVDKVQYDDADGPAAGKPGHWNERPRDVANFCQWAGRQTERDLNWQITNLTQPAAALHDAPFLYLAGNQPLRLAAGQKDKLRQFCQEGGMIFFNADCGGGASATPASAGSNPFVASVVSLGKDLFPDYEFRDLPASSPVYNEQFSPTRWKRPPTIKALTNGVRELLVLLPDDPARAWQLHQTLGTGKEEAFQAMQDLILYGTDKQPLRVKGIPFLESPDPKVKAARTIHVGRLQYDGNWDPEPGGWRRLAAVLHNAAKTDLDVRTIALGKGQLTGDLQAVHLTGTTPVRLSAGQLSELKGYVDRGGTLIVDAAGGSTAFAQSAETFLRLLYPQGLSNALPADDPVFRRFDPDLTVRYRPFARAMLGRLTAPELKTITVRNRPAVYYSRMDLSGGLVGENVDGIIGYDPATATAITAGILLGTEKDTPAVARPPTGRKPTKRSH